MAKSPKPDEAPKLNRRQQFAQTYQMAKKSDPAIGRWVSAPACSAWSWASGSSGSWSVVAARSAWSCRWWAASWSASWPA